MSGVRGSSAEVLRSRLLERAGVPHAFTTRAGGVSGGVFESLNFGNPGELPAHERDPAANIRENWRRVLEACGAPGRELVEVHQVHGAAVHTVRRGEAARGVDGHDVKADAIVTDDPGRVVAVRVADCTPVLLASADGRIVAAVHAGWRGVVAGIAVFAVGRVRALGAASVIAAIGPCIGRERFEIGPEVVAEFERAFGPDAPLVITRRADGKGHADLKEALRLQFISAGVTEIDVLPGCTASEPGRFFSHRASGGRCGRMSAVIGPRPA